jgi:hypothetical protein
VEKITELNLQNRKKTGLRSGFPKDCLFIKANFQVMKIGSLMPFIFMYNKTSSIATTYGKSSYQKSKCCTIETVYFSCGVGSAGPLFMDTGQ